MRARHSAVLTAKHTRDALDRANFHTGEDVWGCGGCKGAGAVRRGRGLLLGFALPHKCMLALSVHLVVCIWWFAFGRLQLVVGGGLHLLVCM
eukprot:359362-Chlamydomonas_euryale.AAC.2